MVALWLFSAWKNLVSATGLGLLEHSLYLLLERLIPRESWTLVLLSLKQIPSNEALGIIMWESIPTSLLGDRFSTIKWPLFRSLQPILKYSICYRITTQASNWLHLEEVIPVFYLAYTFWMMLYTGEGVQWSCSYFLRYKSFVLYWYFPSLCVQQPYKYLGTYMHVKFLF